MIRRSQNYAVRSNILGVALTIAVMAIDWLGGLGALERWFYDRRALYFQRFTPAPDSRLIHLDIDDAALESIGRWPWPRGTLADIVEEVRLAGADVLALDVIFLEPQPVELRVEGGTTSQVDHDRRFSEALQRFGRVLLPISFVNQLGRRPADSPVHLAAVEVLRTNLELDPPKVAARLAPALGPLSEDAFLVARREAMGQRIAEELDRKREPADAIRRRLLPGLRHDDRESSLVQQFDAKFRQAESIYELRRFAMSRPASCPPLLPGNDPSLLPLLAKTTAFTGFANFKPIDDGKVRGLPLWIEHEGLLYPQMDLALACAVWGVDPREMRIERDSITIPASNGRAEIVIPTRVVETSDGEIGAYYDIPWFGGRDWERMYGSRAKGQDDRHVPITRAWGLAESRKTVTRNNAEAMKAMEPFADQGIGSVLAFRNTPPPADDFTAWLAGAEKVMAEVGELLAPVRQTPKDQWTDDERVLLTAYAAIQKAADADREFLHKAAELKHSLGGKVVMVGSTSTAALDHVPTSLHAQCPGVVVHGVMFNTLMTGQFWRFAPAWTTAGVTILLGLAITAIVTWLPPWKALGTTFLLLVTYGALNAVAIFDYGDRIVGLAGPVVVIAAVWSMLTLLRFVIERNERARITRKFRGYVDPQLVEYVVRHPELSRFEGEVREMTVCFTDLVGFTTMTEKLKEDAVPILGRYINRMVGIMRRHRGFLNRLMGDGIMFSYGAPLENPNHAVDAVTTVMEMQAEMTEINRELSEEGLPELAVRGGVSTGKVVVGDSGGTEAVDYTCLGDVTNFGARLESANKYTGTKNLISARTAEVINGHFLLRPIALLQVAGKTKSVMTFEPLAVASEATDEQKNLVAMTQEMIDHYTACRFEECIAATDALDAVFGAAKLTKLYRDTCNRFIIERAPEGFHGQITLTDK